MFYNNFQRFIFFIIFIIIISCNKKVQPQLIYEQKVISKIDTLYFISEKKDTIPCNDFKYSFINKTDTVFVEVFKKEMKIKTIKQIDTVFKEINIIQLPPKKIINKIDNSIRNKAKDNSAIGDNNELKKTTKKSQWWWIFIAGFLSAPVASIVDATSFVINSTNAGDNSAVNWWIVP